MTINKMYYLIVWILMAASLSCFTCRVIATPVTDENLNPGSRGWVLSGDGSGHDATDAGVQIKGYMSATSVNKGGQIDFNVSVNPAQNFTIEIYRAGWYGGAGGRLMLTIGPIAGVSQPACPPDPTFGFIDCDWDASYTLTVPTTWTSGIYLAKLKNASGYDSGAIFVVRDDNRTADFLYQQSVTTYHAYNQYPEGVNGVSLYSGNISGLPRVNKVSFNRPYAGYRTSSNGYGDYPLWELNIVKWLEKEGYDVAYSTNVDTHANGARLLNYKGFLSAGHDEYWSKEMRDAAETARDNGVNLAFLGGNAAYWQVRFEDANRTMVCYKSSSLDPITTPALKTDMFRSAVVNRPELLLLGAQYISYNNLWQNPTYTNLIVKNTSHWAYQGSGMTEDQSAGPLVGYEIDTVDPAVSLPANTEYTILAASPFRTIYATAPYPATDTTQHSVIYKAPNNGGWVFDAGTMSWAWALDYDASYTYMGDRRSPAIQTVTRNILNRFAGVNHAPQGQALITGAPRKNQALGVDTSGISDSDGLGTYSFQWKRDGVNIAGATGNTYQLVTADVGKQISVVVSYTDGLGKLETVTSAATSPVVDDNVPPIVSISEPATGSTISGASVNITADATDSDGVAGVQFKLDGANLGTEDTAAPYSLTWDSTTATNADHILTVVAHDTAENIATSSAVTVTVNNVVPQPDLVITNLSYESGVFTSTVKNQGAAPTPTGTNIDVSYSVDGVNKTVGSITSPIAIGASVTVGTTGTPYTIPSGVHTIAATVDEANLVAEADETNNSLAQTITVGSSDTTAPSVSITAPDVGSTLSGANINITADATDNVAVAGVQFKLDGTNLGAEDTTAPYSLTWDSTTATNANHILTAVARDTAGNIATSSAVTVAVNNIVPQPDLVVTNLTYSNGVFTSTVKNQGAAPTPTGTNIDVSYAVDGTKQTLGSISSPIAIGASVTVGTTGAPYTIPSGTHSITALADDGNLVTEADETNNSLTQSVTIAVVDTTAPSVSITAPDAGSALSGANISITADATDNVAVTGVQFKLDGANLGAEDTSAPYSLTWDSTTATNANHTLTAVARDTSENTTTSSTVSVTVNNIVPQPDLVVTNLTYSNGVFTSTVKNQGAAPTPTGTNIDVSYAVDGTKQTLGSISSPIAIGASVTVGTTGAPYTIPSGTHSITALADDGNLVTEADETNNSLTQSVTIAVVDTTAPIVSVTEPATGSTVNGSTVAVTATATDNVAVAGVQFKLDGANLGAEDTSAPYSLTWDSTIATNANHILTAVARDTAGNAATSSAVTVAVNNVIQAQQPDVIVTALIYSNGVFTSTFKNQGTVATPTGVSIGVGYSVDGTYRTWGARNTSLAAGASATISTDGGAYTIPVGTHTITAKVDDVNRFAELDETNNSLTQTITVGAGGDTTPPTVSISAPANNSTVTGAAVNITATAADNIGVVGVQFQLDGANLGVEDTSVPYSIIWDSTAVTNGNHILTAIARDAAVNSTTSSAITMTVTNSGGTPMPDVVVTDLVYSNGVFTSTIKNQGTVATPTGVSIGVGYSVDGTYRTWGARSTSLAAGASATVSTDGGAYTIPVGTHTITAKVDDVNRFAELDETNNSLTQTITVGGGGDITPPTVSISAPATGSTVNGVTVAVTANASDNVAVAGVQFKLDGANLGAEDTVAPYSITWDSTIVANGNHILNAVARDTVGNTATSSEVTVTVSNTGGTLLPDVMVTNLVYSNGVFTSTIQNQGTAATPAGLSIGVAYSVDGTYRTWGARNTSLAAGASATISTDGGAYTIPGGTHTITAKVDDVNRFAELDENNNSLTQTITVGSSDPTPPNVAVNAPAAGSTVSGATVAVTANASDNVAVAGVQFKLDGANLGAEDTSAPYSITWDSTIVANGNHTISAVARDTSGNTASSSTVTVTVNNTVTTTLPDVVVTALSYSNGVFTCTIINQGTKATPTGVAVGVGYSVDGVYRTWGARNTSLAAGASATVSTNGSAYTIPSGSHTISAKVDDVNRFAELDETNNTFTLPITVP